MKSNPFHELPIRSKLEMVNDVIAIIQCLHRGDRSTSDRLVEDLKGRCAFFDETIQQDVLMFVGQVQFQQVYDPWHKITPEVQRSADRLLHDLGVQMR